MDKKLKIVVSGSRGRMGTIVSGLVKESNDLILAGEAEKDAPLESVIDRADVVIDFTVHDAAAQNAKTAAVHQKPIVIGTTGLSKEEENIIKEASRRTAVVYAPNMSVGVNIMFQIVEMAARHIPPDYNIDVVETHHVGKIDKPSGTAKKMLDIVLAQSLGKTMNDVSFNEELNDKGERPINMCSVRKGDVVGEHTIRFKCANEVLEITHHAKSREIFAQGAIRAARWVIGKAHGLYGMADVLGI